MASGGGSLAAALLGQLPALINDYNEKQRYRDALDERDRQRSLSDVQAQGFLGEAPPSEVPVSHRSFIGEILGDVGILSNSRGLSPSERLAYQQGSLAKEELGNARQDRQRKMLEQTYEDQNRKGVESGRRLASIAALQNMVTGGMSASEAAKLAGELGVEDLVDRGTFIGAEKKYRLGLTGKGRGTGKVNDPYMTAVNNIFKADKNIQHGQKRIDQLRTGIATGRINGKAAIAAEGEIASLTDDVVRRAKVGVHRYGRVFDALGYNDHDALAHDLVGYSPTPEPTAQATPTSTPNREQRIVEAQGGLDKPAGHMGRDIANTVIGASPIGALVAKLTGYGGGVSPGVAPGQANASVPEEPSIGFGPDPAMVNYPSQSGAPTGTPSRAPTGLSEILGVGGKPQKTPKPTKTKELTGTPVRIGKKPGYELKPAVSYESIKEYLNNSQSDEDMVARLNQLLDEGLASEADVKKILKELGHQMVEE